MTIPAFQSSFELTGYITISRMFLWQQISFQSSFELTGYITDNQISLYADDTLVSKLFRAYGLYNYQTLITLSKPVFFVSKLFRAYGLYNSTTSYSGASPVVRFKALSRLRVI